jgi:hypothetical protein
MERRDFLLGFSATGALASPQAAAADADALASRGVKVAPTMADLRALTPKSDDVAWLRGHRRPNDGGEGFFHWDADATDADNGGTVIAPNGGNGRWVRAYSGPINALWFESAAKALDYANVLYDAVLYFPRSPTTYECGDKVVKSGVTIQGEGISSKISGRLRFETGSRHITGACRDVVLQNGAHLRGCRNRLFENVQFGDVVTFDDKAWSHYNTFLNCVWIGVASAINVPNSNHFNKVISCRIALNHGFSEGIKIAHADGWNIIGTSIEALPDATEPFGPFIDLDGRNHTVSGCWLERRYGLGSYEPGVILRGEGISFQFGSLVHFAPLVDQGMTNTVTGALWHATYKKMYLPENSGITTVTPNASGEGTIPHGLYKPPRAAVVCIKGRTANSVDLIDVDGENIKVRIKNLKGNDVSTGSYEISWYSKA